MPKRGSSSSGSIAVIPHKRHKLPPSTDDHHIDEEQDENMSMDISNYSSQLFKIKHPNVHSIPVVEYRTKHISIDLLFLVT